MALNEHFEVANYTRSYPVSDAATAVDDLGRALDPAIIADLQLRFPWQHAVGFGEGQGLYGGSYFGETYFGEDFWGQRQHGILTTPILRGAMLSAVTVSPQLATAVFVACAIDGTDLRGPLLAFVSIPNPVRNIAYPLKPFIPGAAGSIVFGPAVEQPGVQTYRFTRPIQSFLAAKAARAFPPTGVFSLAIGSGQPLTGLVTLQASGNLVIEVAPRTINGHTVDAIVFRLATEQGVQVLQDFVGRCGNPESGTCGDPQPLQQINSVGPDCTGKLTLNFQGAVTPYQITTGSFCGAILNSPIDAAQTCAGVPTMPTLAGILPNEGIDFCNPSSFPVILPTPLPDPPTVEIGPIPPVLPDPLPYIQGFSSLPLDWEVEEGAFQLFAPGFFETIDLSSRNLAIWLGRDNTTMNRVYTTTGYSAQGPVGARHNFGLVVNRRPSLADPSVFVWWTLGIDFDSQTFFLSHFNGVSDIVLISVLLPQLRIADTYKLTFTVQSGVGPSQVFLTGHLVGVTDPSISSTLGPFSLVSFRPSTGHVGLVTTKGFTAFEQFTADHAP